MFSSLGLDERWMFLAGIMEKHGPEISISFMLVCRLINPEVSFQDDQFNARHHLDGRKTTQVRVDRRAGE